MSGQRRGEEHSGGRRARESEALTERTGADEAMEDVTVVESRSLDRLLHRIARGDREALGEVYELTHSSVYGYILSILRNRDDAEDILQDTYVKICTNADQYRTQGKPMAWILTIARNLSLMLIRSRRRYQEIEDYEWEAVADERAEIHSEDRIVLETLMNRISGEERQIVTLHAISGLKHREIAQILDLPLATVLSKYNRAIKKMQKALAE